MSKVCLYILFSVLLTSTSSADPQLHIDDWSELNVYSKESEKNPWEEIRIEGSALFLKKENGEKIKIYKFNDDKYDVYVSRIMTNIYIFNKTKKKLFERKNYGKNTTFEEIPWKFNELEAIAEYCYSYNTHWTKDFKFGYMLAKYPNKERPKKYQCDETWVYYIAGQRCYLSYKEPREYDGQILWKDKDGNYVDNADWGPHNDKMVISDKLEYVGDLLTVQDFMYKESINPKNNLIVQSGCKLFSKLSFP
ncbi:MAG: hypothetical protein P8J38_02575 [Thermodesulfobacteriota bacteirum]|nr:hypothetical protein [Thermodesulfobacteriota bacterium]